MEKTTVLRNKIKELESQLAQVTSLDQDSLLRQLAEADEEVLRLRKENRKLLKENAKLKEKVYCTRCMERPVAGGLLCGSCIKELASG